MNSNEEYLNSLLKSVEQNEASTQEGGIVEELTGPDNFSMPEDLFATMADAEPEEETDSVVEPEIIVQSEETTVLDILKSNPDRLLSPEQIETMFANAEADNNTDDEPDETDNFDIGDLFAKTTEEETVEETSAEEIDVTSKTESDALYSDDVQNMAEDDIMRLLQQSSDTSQTSDNDSMNLDFLFDDISDDNNVAQFEEMIEKDENNEPVSSEVDEMLQLGLKVDTEEMPKALPVLSPKIIFNKIKTSFVNIFKKDKNVDLDDEQLSTMDSVSESTDVPIWDNAQDIDDIPMMESQEDNPKESVDTSFFDQLFVDDSQIEATEISQEEFDGFVEGLFEQEPEVQMLNNDASEISDLLSALENAETEADLVDTNVDLFAGMNQEGDIDLENAGDVDNISETETEATAKKEKKTGFFKRLFTLLTEEDEEPEEIRVTAENTDGVDELGATSEVNKEAMSQLDKEGQEDKKKKKKGKKAKEEVKDGEEDDDDEEPVEDNKKKKKPKKVKKQKEPKIYDDSPKLSKKKIRATVLAAISIAAAILVISLFVPELFELKSARNAFYDGDYETSYKALYGKKLSDSDRIIFEQSEFLLALQRRVESYYNYMAIDDELRAVESLILEVDRQKDILIQAEKYGLEAEAESSYQDILQILFEKYGVSEEDALTINAYRQDALFTLHLKAIVAGEEFVCPDYLSEDGQVSVSADVQEDIVVETLEDILPAEEELTETEFEEGTN